MNEPPERAKTRPWYLSAAMTFMLMMGIFGAMGGCQQLDYLRGGQQLPDQLQQDLADTSNPLVRLELMRQQELITALGAHHERAFPLSLARILMGLFLVVASSRVLSGRRGSRGLAFQALAGNAALAAIAFSLLAPARAEMIEAVTARAVAEQTLPEKGVGVAATQLLRGEIAHRELLRAGMEGGILLLAALVLTRRRARAYFEEIEEGVGKTESPHGQP